MKPKSRIKNGQTLSNAGRESHPDLITAIWERRAEPKIGRNDPYPCGSGKKYKKRHGRPGN